MPGTREHCIELYVDCQQNAVRGFDVRGCQPCMDQCMGDEYRWPKGEGCNYRETRTRYWLERTHVIF